MLQEADAARQALASNNTQQAKQDLNSALDAADHLKNNAGQNGIVPLYTELGQYTLIGPRQNKQANSSTNNQTTANQTVAVRKVTGDFTAVTVNLNTAHTHLEAAKQALDKGDTKAARDALMAVQDSVAEEEIAADMPLMRARENLMLSRDAVNKGDYHEAHAALQAASNALANYSQDPLHAGTYANDAKQLRSDIDSYNASIQQNHSDASSKIESWWNQVTDWNSNNGTSNQSSLNTKNSGYSASNKHTNSK